MRIGEVAQMTGPAGLSCRIYQTELGPAGSPTIDELAEAIAAAS